MVAITTLVLFIVIAALRLVADGKNVKQTFLIVASSISNDSNTTLSPALVDERWILNKSGSIVSLQDDIVGNPEWIVSGKWNIGPRQLILFSAEDEKNFRNNNSTLSLFNATITMSKIDGTEQRRHTITDFNLIGKPAGSNNDMLISLNGTSTVTTREKDFTDVPTIIRLTRDSVISISFESDEIRSYFGNTSIYGTIKK
jgi:hypothetical protein